LAWRGVGNQNSDNVMRIDPATMHPGQPSDRRRGDAVGEKVFTLPGRLLRAGPDLWVTDSKRDELVLDVSTGNPKARRIPTPAWPLAMVEGGGAVWAASFNGAVILRLDPAGP
jgi:hypothetical protein